MKRKVSVKTFLQTILLFVILAIAPAALATTTNVSLVNDTFSPANVTINVGDTVKWNWENGTHSTSSGSPPGTKNNIWDSGDNSSPFSYSITFTNAGSFPYFCDIHYPIGMVGSVTVSNSAASNGPPAPIVSITWPSEGATFAAPASFTLTATASVSSGIVTNVEFLQGGSVLGALTNAPYEWAVSNLGAGGYSFSAIAMAAGISTTSAVVSITVAPPPPTNQPPSITMQPESVTVLAGADANFSVTATGQSPLSYQWFMGTNALATATNSTLMLTGVTLSNAGSYSVMVTNAFGTTNSQVATLTILTNTNTSPDQIDVTIVGQGTINKNLNGQTLTIGHSYTMTAEPARNWLFFEWLGSIETNTAKLKFTAAPEMVLQAVFLTNNFPALHGAYAGLFAPNGMNRAQTNSGYLAFALSSASTASGQLLLGADKLSFNAKFLADGSANFLINRHGQTPLDVQLQLNVSNQTVSGSVTDGGFDSEYSGFLNGFSARNPASDFVGHYTLIIPGVGDTNLGPAGASYGTSTVSSSGTITFSGSLADGTSVSESSIISSTGQWPFYLSLYKGGGSIWGWNTLSNNAVTTNLQASWINGGNAAPTAALRGGFTNFAAQIITAPYNANADPLFGTSGTVILQDGVLGAPLTIPISVSASGKITPGSATDHLALSINKQTGVISGTFSNPASASQHIKIAGVILETPGAAQGYFLEDNQSGSFLLQP